VLLVAVAAFVTGSATWGTSQTGGRLAVIGAALFVLALLLGSARFLGVSSLLGLAALLATTLGSDMTSWVRALVVGALWYLAVELGWDAIERRDGVRRTPAYVNRRLEETSTVVLLSVVLTAGVFFASEMAPLRTILVIATALIGIAVALGLVASGLRRP
jgi:hypothetical protein